MRPSSNWKLVLDLVFSSGFQLRIESNLRLLWFCIFTPLDWLKQFAPFSQPEVKPKPIVTISRAFSRASRLLNAFASS